MTSVEVFYEILIELAAKGQRAPYSADTRLLIDGMPSNPFSMQTLSPPPITEDRFAIVTERSRRQHAQPFEMIQAEIAGQWRA